MQTTNTPMDSDSSDDGLPIRMMGSKCKIVKKKVVPAKKNATRKALGRKTTTKTTRKGKPTNTTTSHPTKTAVGKENVCPSVPVAIPGTTPHPKLAASDMVTGNNVGIPGGGGVTSGDITDDAITKNISDPICMGHEISVDDASLLFGETLVTRDYSHSKKRETPLKEMAREVDDAERPGKKVRRLCALVCGPKTPFKQQLMNTCMVIIISMWKKKQVVGKEDFRPYSNELQPNTMETHLKMVFSFFHIECIVFHLARNFNYEGGGSCCTFIKMEQNLPFEAKFWGQTNCRDNGPPVGTENYDHQDYRHAGPFQCNEECEHSFEHTVRAARNDRAHRVDVGRPPHRYRKHFPLPRCFGKLHDGDTELCLKA
jgi:hypothetical protein